MGLGNTGGLGASLGSAVGTVTIKTSGAEVQTLVEQLEQVGVVGERATGRAEAGASRAGSRFRTLSSNVVQAARDMQLISLAAGGIAAIGLKMVGQFENAEVALRGMVGSTGEALELMDRLRQKARDAGLPFQQVLRASQLLLPTLEGNVDQMEQYLDLAQRVAVLNPQEGIQGAAFAINELVSSGGTDIVSLAERFNIPRASLRALIEETGDIETALDQLLNRMGITTQTAEEMGQTFTASLLRARDAAGQLLEAGFRPLVDEALTPMLNKLADLAFELRETNPLLLEMGAAMIAATAAGPGLILAVNALAKAAPLLATFAGAGLGTIGGIGAVRAIGAVTGNERLQEYNLGDLLETLRQVGVILRNWPEAMDQFKDALEQATIKVGEFEIKLGELFREGGPIEQGVQEAFKVPIGPLQGIGAALQRTPIWDQIPEGLQAFLQPGMERFLPGGLFALGGEGGMLGGVGTGSRADRPQDEVSQALQDAADETLEFTQDQVVAWAEYQDELAEISDRAEQERLDVIQRIEDQKTQIVERTGQQIIRLNEDRELARTRGFATLQSRIDQVRADADDRQDQMVADSQARQNNLVESFQVDEERRLEDHERRLADIRRNARRAIADAVGRLDAVALLDAIRSRNQAVASERENFSVESQRRAENLQRQLEQEAQGLEERLKQARAADDRRIADMKAAFDQQQKIADEDLQRRVERMQEDMEAQLALLDEQKAQRLDQIIRQEDEELTLREQAWRAEFLGLLGHEQAMLNTQFAGLEEQEQALRDWFNRNTAWIRSQTSSAPLPTFTQEREGGTTGTTADFVEIAAEYNPTKIKIPGVTSSSNPVYLQGFQHGGPVGSDMLARLHAGEEVLRSDVARTVRGAMGGSIDQDALAAILGGRGLSLEAGAVTNQFGDIGGHSEERIRDLFEGVLMDLLQELG